jgi:prepilin-type N-terminal cleavage/methylation domain-containing protein
MGRRAALSASRGFTLLELVVTLSILALAVGLAVPTISRSMDGIRARADVAGFSAMMRHGRERAIVSRRSQAVVIDPAARRVSLVAGGPDGEVRETRSACASRPTPRPRSSCASSPRAAAAAATSG